MRRARRAPGTASSWVSLVAGIVAGATTVPLLGLFLLAPSVALIWGAVALRYAPRAERAVRMRAAAGLGLGAGFFGLNWLLFLAYLLTG